MARPAAQPEKSFGAGSGASGPGLIKAAPVELCPVRLRLEEWFRNGDYVETWKWRGSLFTLTLEDGEPLWSRADGGELHEALESFLTAFFWQRCDAAELTNEP